MRLFLFFFFFIFLKEKKKFSGILFLVAVTGMTFIVQHMKKVCFPNFFLGGDIILLTKRRTITVRVDNPRVLQRKQNSTREETTHHSLIFLRFPRSRIFLFATHLRRHAFMFRLMCITNC